ncbi:hypothetical protein THAOC_09857 [Thalassiosira oceanica]|uniref:Uncharacterized protein n=1 Tax=Thalassiosira oceanica TaxID=159749 RepID=K0SU32_THAOC|nr:hypothetical protein THAOC_09857 [Thalassiosira oceanica]|mmetsp:Transcript_682/g.1580  ORF Transcript_682/g.1580 Transcript_682/m.1580 type:complete len:605 (-) Transcript_682:30-1844(-)|eukprot:EJK68930.1 hypothetical protein THAOC_09857 [Thalassiosira oceanica]
MSGGRRNHLTQSSSERVQRHVGEDVENLSDNYDATAPSVGLDMAGHDQHLLGPKVVILDAFVVDLLNVDTSAQTFRLKLMLNMDWEDDGTIEPEVKAKRNLGRPTSFAPSTGYSTQGSLDETSSFASDRDAMVPNGSRKQNHSSRAIGKIPSKIPSNMLRKASKEESVYKTGKYVLKRMYQEDPLGTTWNPAVVLANAIADESPIEGGSKFHSVNMLANRPVISRQILYQPECRCEFTFSNFPFDETDLVVKFSSNKWNAEQVDFLWSNRLSHSSASSRNMRHSFALRRDSSILRRGVDNNAIGGIGLSEFEITKVRVENVEKDMNSMQRYDMVEGVFSEAHLIIRVRRDPYSYLLRVAVVAELLMLLEFLSFLTDKDDLSARFSISGTIFLAMVSLYGPMADALPKVSVVTRVDKWHLFNFTLLFASNVENLVAYLLRNTFNAYVLYYIELILGLSYTYLVVQNLLWFVKPLTEREEFDLLISYVEDKIDEFRQKAFWCVEKLTPSFVKRRRERRLAEEKARRESLFTNGFNVARAASKLKGGLKSSGIKGGGKLKSKGKTRGILFRSFLAEDAAATKARLESEKEIDDAYDADLAFIDKKYG